MLLNYRVRGTVAPQWHDLGEKLLKQSLNNKLDDIGRDNHGDVKQCYIEMFQYWLDNFEANWNKMIDALKQRGQEKVVVAVKRNSALKGFLIVMVFCTAYLICDWICKNGCSTHIKYSKFGKL